MSTPSTSSMRIRIVDDLLEKIKNVASPVGAEPQSKRLYGARYMIPGRLVGAAGLRARRG
jgi:hypothetical protein